MSVPVSVEPSPEQPQRRRGLQTLRTQAAAVPRAWLPGAVGYTCLLIGLVDIASAVFPKLRHTKVHTFAGQLPGGTTTLAAAGTLMIGLLLVLLAHALRRRKRRAWRVVCVLLPVGAALHLLRWHQLGPAVISMVLFVVMLVHRREFYAKADPRTRWRAVVNLVVLGTVSVLIGLLIVSTRTKYELGHPGLYQRLEHVLYGLFGFEGPVHYNSDRMEDLVGYLLGAMGLITAFTTTYLALRPEKPKPELTAEDEVRVRALLDRHGERDSLGYFALRRDKSVLFSPTGKAAISYRVVSGVMLASGDPVGDVEAWPGAIKVFMAEAREHAWVPAVMGCSEVGGEVWTREAGLDALELGDEAIVDTASFSLAGRAMRNVRQMVKRIERNGYSCQVRRVSELGREERQRIADAAARWRGTDTERGFSMALGRFGEPGDDACVVVTAHKAPEEGESGDDLKAVLHFVPWGEDGISLELMRRDRAADPGLNELLIVAALQAVPAMGVRRVSLNFAMFRSALARGERIGAGPVLRAWRGLLVFLSRWFQIESLYKFNAKFQPEWEPRFLVFPNTRDLPRIGFAAMQAEAFITLGMPRFGRKPRRQELQPAGARPEVTEAA
ncbi:phosphatidylglycerol lysyltransferase domain-containing protein [Kitasatospora purpeofusca]|uniref:phosphatidylglycerol lysyltransferase domain-containing protein n=1 Tax=Kitasatospora purpeofusca TaxID=67352 RepID=UPI002250281D|nr:phosphatidylglycerol lysyltransferase domain-containing protein [Kitasatospora purpeofusca]MCX4686372.1 phosphatidylglycerol lysyltransferase domain-containing protein [Kitasatospora purpeofusca]